MRIINQRIENVPVADVRPHPQNPNQGDVGAIFESIEQNGFYGTIGVQASTGHILWGNHRYEAARQAGATEIPAVILDVDDAQALRILLVDNRSAQLAKNDDNVLADILQSLAMTDDGLKGTGYTDANMDDILASLGQSTSFDDQEATDEVLRFDQVEFTIRIPKAQASEAMESLIQSIASEHGGRFIKKGAK